MRMEYPSQEEFDKHKELAIAILKLSQESNVDPQIALHSLDICFAQCLSMISPDLQSAMRYADSIPVNVRTWLLEFDKWEKEENN